MKVAREELFTCPKCGRGNFTQRWLRAHVCRPKDGQGVAPNEHGVLPVTETLEISPLPRGWHAQIRLTQYERLWYYGLDWGKPDRDGEVCGASRLPNVGDVKWSTRAACLEAAADELRQCFSESRAALRAIESLVARELVKPEPDKADEPRTRFDGEVPALWSKLSAATRRAIQNPAARRAALPSLITRHPSHLKPCPRPRLPSTNAPWSTGRSPS